MNHHQINEILDREHISKEIRNILTSFDKKCKDIAFKKGIYIYGSPGSGKSVFIRNILLDLNYDVIQYDAGDVRNKSLIETITSNNMASRNVLQLMSKQVKKIAIIMDEIDGMNNGDKGGITSLIKLIRQKKTKKQKLEAMTMNPIICIGNYYVDKKIKELMKVCNVFELKSPTEGQITALLTRTINPVTCANSTYSVLHIHSLVEYIQGDLRKYDFVKKIHSKRPELLMDPEIMCNVFHTKHYSENSKKITQKLLQGPVALDQHCRFMNETDRTIVALLWHENIVDAISGSSPLKSIPFYFRILENICFSDFIDRITFQNQIWQFNEMSSLIKTFYNNKLYHDTFSTKTSIENTKPMHDVRFTKVLTKYSTEYNNILFIYNLCQKINMDKKDLVAFFQELRLHYLDTSSTSSTMSTSASSVNDKLALIEKLFENTEIDKLNVRRMYRYLDKNVKRDSATLEDEDDDIDDP